MTAAFRHILISDHCLFAVRTKNQSTENMGNCSQLIKAPDSLLMDCPTLLGHLFNGEIGNLINKRFMRVRNYNPFGLGPLAHFFALGKNIVAAALNHMAKISLARKDHFNNRNMPNRVGIAFSFDLPSLIMIAGWGRYPHLIQFSSDF